jgi:Uma2 family endonuclease
LLARHPATQAGKAWVELSVTYPPHNYRTPDVAWFRPGRLPYGSQEATSDAPDLVAEVRSQGQSVRALEERLAFFRAQGTGCTLLVDPIRKTVEVRDGDRPAWTAAETEDVVLQELDGFSFKVSELFS